MKEIDYRLKDIFTGISPAKIDPKAIVRLLECHNIELDGSVLKNKEYKLHEEITDLDDV